MVQVQKARKFKLPRYLRLLLHVYREGRISLGQRRRYGFTLNDVSMLEAYGLARRNGDYVEITDGGREAVKEILELASPTGKTEFVDQDPLMQRYLEAKEALGILVKVLGEVIVLVEPYALRYKDYSLEKTWVLNKIKKRYYYYYLKSAKRRPHSIYLGSMPVDYPLCKNLAEYVRKIEKTMKMLQKIDIELRYVEAAINITRRLQALEKPIAKIKAKQIPTITEGD